MILTAGSALAQAPPPPLPPAFPRPMPSSLPSMPAIPAATSTVIHDSAVQQAGGAGRPEYGRPPRDDYDAIDIEIKTDIPPLGELMKRDSEADFFERLRQEARKRPGAERVPFPEEQPLTREAFTPRTFQPLVKFVEPSYVAYGRLTMEQPNWERAGWDLGALQPGVCLAEFWWDTLTMPYQMCKRPFNQMDTSAGKMLPGDPDPLVLYPPEFSLSGAAGMAASATAGFLALPFGLPVK